MMQREHWDNYRLDSRQGRTPALWDHICVPSQGLSPLAILDSRKSVLFAQKLSVPVVGIIENMSGLKCPHCEKRIDLFGTGGGEKAAHDLKVPFLGRIPIEQDIVKLSDSGEPFVHFRKDTETAKILDGIIDRVVAHVKDSVPADRSGEGGTERGEGEKA